MRNQRITRDVSRYFFLSVFAAGILIPFVSVITTALNPPGTLVNGLQWPAHPTIDSFIYAWTTASFGRLISTSTIISLIVVPLSAVLSIFAAYAIAQLQVFAGRLIYNLFILGLILPFELIIIPLYFNMRSMGLTDSILGIVLAESAAFIPFGVFWMHASFSGFPREIIEAALVDGASNFTILRSVLLPLSRPAIVTMCVLLFMWSWNQFLLILILISNPENRTAPGGLGFFVTAHTRDLPSLCAATLLVIFPIVVVYVIFQRSFIAGMLQGAVKA